MTESAVPKLTTIDLIDSIIREDYGGCHPKLDDPCILKARVSDHESIEVFIVGKWRSMTGYHPRKHKDKLPSPRIIKRALETLRANTGKTFAGKQIILQFKKEE